LTGLQNLHDRTKNSEIVKQELLTFPNLVNL